MACLQEDVKEWVYAYPEPPLALSENVLMNLGKLQRLITASSFSSTEVSNTNNDSDDEREDDDGVLENRKKAMQNLLR